MRVSGEEGWARDRHAPPRARPLGPDARDLVAAGVGAGDRGVEGGGGRAVALLAEDVQRLAGDALGVWRDRGCGQA
eukprot:353813-Rhodomonas_salina.5